MDIDNRIRFYRHIQARINIIDLDIQLREIKGEYLKDLLIMKKTLLEEEYRIEQALSKLNERELFIISILYNSNITVTELAELLGMNRSSLSIIKSRTLKKLEKSIEG